MIELKKTFEFSAAHHLKDYDGKCANNHGHNYKLEVMLRGEPDENGMLIDFNEIKNIVQENILSVLDHSDLNDILEQPTAENTAKWIYDKLKPRLPQLQMVELWETRKASASYTQSK